MRSITKALHSIGVLLLFALFTGQALAQNLPSAFVKVNRTDLIDEVRSKGEISIIAGLNVPSAALPLAAQASPVVLQQRMKDIDSAQTRLIGRLANSQISHVKKFKYHPYVAMRVNEWALNEILQDANVVSVEEDHQMRPALTATPQLVDALPAWDAGHDGAGQTVAIFDTGVDTAHPFLSGKTVAEACFSAAPGGYISLCPNGQGSQLGAGAGIHCSDSGIGCYHGTHVAGIAVGKRGVIGADAGGMAPAASLIPVQVFVKDCSVSPCDLSAFTSDIISAFDYVYSLRATYNIAAVNLSLSGAPTVSPCDSYSPSLTASINSFRAANIATVIAAGNAGNSTQVGFPACISSAISVGSTTKLNAVSSFSNGGAALELFAPGSSIYSSLPGGGFGYLSGTSMASPHVAGAWAAVKSARPESQVSEVLNAFTLTGTPILDARNGITRPLIQIDPAIAALGAPPPPGASINVAAQANGGVATASSFYSSNYPPAAVNNGDRKGFNWNTGGGWNDATSNLFPDWVQVTFNGPKLIDEIDVFSAQDNYTNPVEPTVGMTFTKYGLTTFEAQYWNGTTWVTVPGGSISGNNLVWRKINFTPLTTDRIRVLVHAALNDYSRAAEIEAYSDEAGGNASPTVSLTTPANGAIYTALASITLGATASDSDGAISQVAFYNGTTLLNADAGAPYSYTWSNVPAGVYTLTAKAYDNTGAITVSAPITVTVNAPGASLNVAAQANGGVATASSFYSSNYPPAAVNNGDRKGFNWNTGGGWNDATSSKFPDWVQVTFNGPKLIYEIDVFSAQDNYTNPAEPTAGMTFTKYGLMTFEAQYWNGTTWVTVPGGNISGNNLVWRKINFTPLTTDRIRILVHAALDGYSRAAEIEAYSR